MKIILSALAALALFAGAHRICELEGADQWERAAYMVWAVQCDRGEVLCIHRAPCGTDTECENLYGAE